MKRTTNHAVRYKNIITISFLFMAILPLLLSMLIIGNSIVYLSLCCGLLAITFFLYVKSRLFAAYLYFLYIILLGTVIISFLYFSFFIYLLFLPQYISVPMSLVLLISFFMLFIYKYKHINKKHIATLLRKREILNNEIHIFNYTKLLSTPPLPYFKKIKKRTGFSNFTLGLSYLFACCHPILLGVFFILGRYIKIQDYDIRLFIFSLILCPLIAYSFAIFFFQPVLLLFSIIKEYETVHGIKLKIQ